jgi:uncharacterized protein YciI
MKHFYYKLIPPRPTFPADMTEAEGAIMQEHFSYWQSLIADGKAVAYGPVMDPKGTYGIAIVLADDVEAVQEMGRGDPAIKAKAGFGLEVHEMPGAMSARATR